MAWLAVVIVSAFESVGAILVVAALIVPGATATLLSTRLPRILALIHGARRRERPCGIALGRVARLFHRRRHGGGRLRLVQRGLGRHDVAALVGATFANKCWIDARG